MKTSPFTFASSLLTAALIVASGSALHAIEGAGVAAEGRVELPPEVKAMPIEEAILTSPPHVPPPITRNHPARVVVHLEVREVEHPMMDGVTYTYWTFGGTVPGSFIRVREGDVIEFHLNNHPSSKLPHNIDLHAVNGSGGGATSSFTAPGHSSQFTFTALHPGLFVYHCATAPVPMHVGNGMYGMILVQPKEGLPPVDHEYYVMQGDFYTQGNYGESGLQNFDMSKAIDERASYVVFNGSVGSMVGDNALTAKVGETVRLYFGVGGPNLASSFHVIGEIFDTVYAEGSLSHPLHNVQTTLVPPGGAAVVDFKVDVPGTYILVDHALSRAFNKGALGMLKVSGETDRLIYSGKEIDAVYLGAQAEAGTDAQKREVELQKKIAAEIQSNPTIASLNKEVQFERGKQVYMQLCFACHMPDGKGLPKVFPPLAQADYLLADKDRAIRVVIKGLTGPITVNGETYNSAMPAQPQLSEEEVANVVTYILNEWGNDGGTVDVKDVRRVKGETK